MVTLFKDFLCMVQKYILIKQLPDLVLSLSAVFQYVRATRTYLSFIRGRKDKQLGWIASSRGSFKQSTNLAWTLWPKISFPGASPKTAKQHEHNKSPPPDTSILEPLLLNYFFYVCFHAKRLFTKA